MNKKIETKKLIALTSITTAILLLLVFIAVYKFAGYSFVIAKDYKKAMDIKDRYEKLEYIQDKIKNKAYFEAPDKKQMDAACKAVVKTLGDEYSEYFTAKEAKEWESYINGTFYGIGVVFTQNKNGSFVIKEVMDQSPAKAAGLKPGDFILKVDGKEYKDSDALRKSIQGKEGSQVSIEYKRKDKIDVVKITRGEVKEITVQSLMLKDRIGYLRINSFAEKTSSEFKKELKSMEKKNIKGLIIDIRGNGGGYADQGIKVADMLLPEGTITFVKDKAGKKTNYNSDENATKLKYVLLVDEGTASTSELLSGAIKDNKGGKLVGTKTYGKGVMQVEYPFEDGSALKITTHQFFTPKGNIINKKGIKPDYIIKNSLTDKTDKQLEKAIELLK